MGTPIKEPVGDITKPHLKQFYRREGDREVVGVFDRIMPPGRNSLADALEEARRERDGRR